MRRQLRRVTMAAAGVLLASLATVVLAQGVLVQGVLVQRVQAQRVQAQGALQAERLAHGRVVAERWCANCHVVGPAQTRAPGDAAPPFAAIAGMPSATEMSLRVFLQTPHANMPDYQLSQRELDSVVAYILSLRPQGGRS